MRVVIIPSWFPSANNFFLQQATAIARKGIVQDMLAVDITGISDILRYPASLRFCEEKYSVHNVSIVRGNWFKRPGEGQFIPEGWTSKVIRIFNKYVQQKNRPDLIHAHSSLWAGYAGALLSRKYNVPMVITEHRSRFISTPESDQFFKPYFHPFLNAAFGAAVKVITVSDAMQTMLTGRFKVPLSKIVTIPNMIDCTKIQPLCSKDNRPFIFITACRLEEEKGVDILIRAFGLLSKREQEILLVIVGDGSKQKELKQLTAALSLTEQIKFTGILPHNETLKQIQHAHCFVLSSRLEAFGVVLAEAMAGGLPLIATRCGGPEKIITPDTGLLAEKNNPQSLAAAMQQMIEQYKNFDPAHIRSSALIKYDEPVVADQIIEVYQEAIAIT